MITRKDNPLNAFKWKQVGRAAMLIAGLCVLLSGCSSSPSPGDGERAIQHQINEQAQGRIKLVKFEKLNATQGELMGIKIYGLEFNAEIEFTEDCKWITGVFGQQLSFKTSIPVAQPKSGFSMDSFADASMNPGALVKKGQLVKMSGTVRFVKKEKGWEVDEVELTKADVAITTQSAQAQAKTSQPEPTTPAQAKVEQKIVEPSPISENTEAFEFAIVSQEKLPRQCSSPAFSHNFSSIAYVAKRQLVVRAVSNSKSIKSIRLPADVSSVAFSPDGENVACLITGSEIDGHLRPAIDAHLLFVNLQTEKITPVKLSRFFNFDGQDDWTWYCRLTWPNDKNLYIHGSRGGGQNLNLDTLQTSDLGDSLSDLGGKNDWQINSNKNAVLRIGDSMNGDGHSLILDSTKFPYGRVVIFDADIDERIKRYGWSPDLRFCFEWKYDWNDAGICTIYRFGVGGKSKFEDQFQLKGLNSVLSTNQKNAISEALLQKKQVWFRIYRAVKNPLNDKAIGPERKLPLGRGLITSFGDTSRVTYGLEYLPVSEGDIATDFAIKDGDSFGENIWLPLTRIGD